MTGALLGSLLLTPMMVVAVAASLVRPPVRSLPIAQLTSHRGRNTRANQLALLLVAGLGLLVIGPVAVVIAAALAATRKGLAVRAHRAARRRTARHFPDAVDLFVVAVRAGFLPAEAMQRIRRMVPTSLNDPVDSVCRQLAAGSTFSDAVDTLRVSVGPAAYAFVDALAAADRYGLPLAPVLDRLAGEARDQRRRDGEASARELPVRLAAPLVLCTLPSFALLAIAPLLLGALSSLQL